MSLIYIDGFDDGLLSQKWNTLTNAIITASGRNGNGLSIARSSTSSNKAIRILPAADEHATLTLGFAVYPDTGGALSTGSVYGLCGFHADASVTQHVTISVNSDGTLTARRGAGNGTALGTSTLAGPLIVAGQWNHVSVKVSLHDSTGTVEIKINDTTVLSLTGQDTKNAGTDAVFDSFHLGSPSTSSAGHNFFFDDLYVTNGAGSINTGSLGDRAVETLLPNGNGTTNQWVGSDGNSTDNYLLVDETTPSSTDYSGSATSGERDLYAMANLSRASGSIAGAIATAWAGNSDAGAQSIKHVCKSGATTDVGSSVSVTTTYVPLQKVYELDPNTAAAWTVGNVNSAEFGAEVT